MTIIAVKSEPQAVAIVKSIILLLGQHPRFYRLNKNFLTYQRSHYSCSQPSNSKIETKLRQKFALDSRKLPH